MKSFKLEMNIDDSLWKAVDSKAYMNIWKQKKERERERKKEKAHIHIKDCMSTFKLYIDFQNKKREIPYLTEEVLITEGTASICLDSLLTQSSFIIIIIIRSEMIVLRRWYCLLNGINLPTICIKIEDLSDRCIRI